MGRLHAPAARRAEFPRAGHAAARAGAGARPRQPRGRRGAGTRLRRAGLRLTAQFRAGGLRGRGGRDRPEKPARAVARPRRTQLYLRTLPHALAAAARHLPRPGAAVRQGVELGRTGPQRQRRLSGLRGGRAQTRRRHRRRGDAARAAVRGADVVHAPRGTARPSGLPALDLALLRTGAQPHQPLRGAGKQGAARKGAARGRDLPRLCRHRDQQCLPDDAPPVRPGDGSGDPHAPARNGDRAAAPDLHRGRAGRGHGPARGSEPRRRRRAGANAVRRIRRGRTAPDALGAQHHDRLDGHQIQPLHDRHPARCRSGLPPGAGYPESGESGCPEHPGLRGHRPGLRENPGGKPSSRHPNKCPGTAQHPGTT